jgi:hypothetical protein
MDTYRGDIVYAKRAYTGLPFKEPGRRNPLTRKVTAQLYSLGGKQLPYFSITSSTYDNRGRMISGGATGEEGAGPLAPYVKWHLTSTDGPMHYLANAMYWAGFNEDGSPSKWHSTARYDGERVPPRWDSVANVIVLGSVEGDPDVHALSLMPGLTLRRFLIEREPKVIAAFKADMLRLFEEQAEGVERAFAHVDPRKEVA